MTKVSIIQSNYVPWRGYFDIIASSDIFVLFDDTQYTRRDWRNRNQIKTPDGLKWLTVPVRTKGQYTQLIKETLIDGEDWRGQHLRSITANYSRAAHYGHVMEWLAPMYESESWETISQLNSSLIRAVCRELGIQTSIRSSSEFFLAEERSERLAGICSQLDATCYISGPAARGYLDEAVFTDRGIAVEWFDYSGYPDYPQLWGEFAGNISVLDLLLNCGPESAGYLRRDRPA